MKSKNILSAFIFCFVLGTALISCSKSGGGGGGTGGGGTGGGGTGGATTVNITMNAMSFSPSTVTVKVGTIVKWTNGDINSAHTATSDDGTTFSSGSVAYLGSYSYTATVAGTFPYRCTIHAGMNGTLVVTP